MDPSRKRAFDSRASAAADTSEADAPAPKKHHFTALELQKKQLDKLLEKVDKPVVIPNRPQVKSASYDSSKEPKNYVKNVQGSSAGAGSGEFHVYRAGRRREYTRLKNIELESKAEKEQREYEEKVQAKKLEDERRTEKNRAKRRKRVNNSTLNKKNKNNDKKNGEDEEEERSRSRSRSRSRTRSPTPEALKDL